MEKTEQQSNRRSWLEPEGLSSCFVKFVSYPSSFSFCQIPSFPLPSLRSQSLFHRSQPTMHSSLSLKPTFQVAHSLSSRTPNWIPPPAQVNSCARHSFPSFFVRSQVQISSCLIYISDSFFSPSFPGSYIFDYD